VLREAIKQVIERVPPLHPSPESPHIVSPREWKAAEDLVASGSQEPSWAICVANGCLVDLAGMLRAAQEPTRG
jgi:hypothetical protein